LREFKEEVGIEIDSKSKFFELGSIRQKGGKVVHAWGVENDWEGEAPVASSTYTMEWPPDSGKMRSFPEVDRAQFFSIEEARQKIKDTQIPLLDRLESLLKAANE
jgi:predicted NUDIX family NTP pyrophosphohydrolase